MRTHTHTATQDKLQVQLLYHGYSMVILIVHFVGVALDTACAYEGS